MKTKIGEASYFLKIGRYREMGYTGQKTNTGGIEEVKVKKTR